MTIEERIAKLAEKATGKTIEEIQNTCPASFSKTVSSEGHHGSLVSHEEIESDLDRLLEKSSKVSK